MTTKPQSTAEETLEQCPFCGANAFISWDGDVNSPDDWSANCDNTLDCGATVGGLCSEDAARKAWNSRISPASAAPVVDKEQAYKDLLALRQQVEDTILVAKKDEDAEGFITAYHFNTGAIHRLLAEARK